MSTAVKLTRKQVREIWKLFKVDKSLKDVTIVEDNTNGIGPTIQVEFTSVKDITDTETW